MWLCILASSLLIGAVWKLIESYKSDPYKKHRDGPVPLIKGNLGVAFYDQGRKTRRNIE